MSNETKDKSKVYGGFVKVDGEPFVKRLFYNGTEVEFTAVPIVGYDFVSWGVGKYGSKNPIKITINGDVKLRPVFKKSEVKVGFSFPDSGIKFACKGDGIYKSGEEVTVECVVPYGYEFVSWTDDKKVLVSHSNPYSFKAKESVVLIPNLKIKNQKMKDNAKLPD